MIKSERFRIFNMLGAHKMLNYTDFAINLKHDKQF